MKLLPRKTIWVLAGEVSGDILGAMLMASLRARDPSLSFCGVGGTNMGRMGLHSLFPMADIQVMGLTEVLPRIPLLLWRLHQAQKNIEHVKPDMVITIDSPGFSFRLMRRIQGQNLIRVHYVAPQSWAWKSDKFSRLHGAWDHLLCLFSFEEKLFNAHDLHARFVGHPLLQRVKTGANKHMKPCDAQAPYTLLLLPGSRESELQYLLPVFDHTLRDLQRHYPHMEIAPIVFTTETAFAQVNKLTQRWPCKARCIYDPQEKEFYLRRADLALSKSGTATTELVLWGVPTICVYKVHPLTAFMARRLIHVPFVSMVNLLAGEALIPEFLQDDCRSDLLVPCIVDKLKHPPSTTSQAHKIDLIKKATMPSHGVDASGEAARVILALFDSSTAPH